MSGKMILLWAIVVCPINMKEQVTIKSGSSVKAGLLTNASISINFSQTNLFLTGTNQMSTIAPLTLQGLFVEGKGTKTLKGDWTMTPAAQLNREQ